MSEEMRAHAPIRATRAAALGKRILPAAAHDVVHRRHQAGVPVVGIPVAGEDVWQHGPDLREDVFARYGEGRQDYCEGGVQEERVRGGYPRRDGEGGGDGGAVDFGHGGFGVCQGR